MNRHKRVIVQIIGLLLLAIVATASAFGGESHEAIGQTWPSRTPTASRPPDPPSPPATEKPPEPTSTAATQPEPTPVSTEQPPTPSPSPLSGLASKVPQAPGADTPTTDSQTSSAVKIPSAAEVGDCGLPPLAVALGSVRVRSGPGVENESIAELDFQDERLITGRASTAAWWRILLASDQQGWVSDQAVSIAGYVGAVPIIVDGQDDASNVEWQPTPNPLCTPASQEETELYDGQLAELLQAPRSTPVASEADNTAPSSEPTNEGSQASGSPASAESDAGSFNLLWLPIIGALFIAAGVVALIIQRWQA